MLDSPAEVEAVLAVVVGFAMIHHRVVDKLKADAVAGIVPHHTVMDGHALRVEKVNGTGLASVENAAALPTAIGSEVFHFNVLDLKAGNQRESVEDFAVVFDMIVHVQEAIEVERVAPDSRDGAHARRPPAALFPVNDGDTHTGTEAAGVFHCGLELAVVGVDRQLAVDSRCLFQDGLAGALTTQSNMAGESY